MLANGAAAGAPETGLAAVYTTRLAGHKTASGKVYNPNRLTMAHKTLPFGTKVKVVNKKNNRSVVLIVTDRGPTQAGRVADISSVAARKLGIRPNGMAEVELTPQ
jgi:rare lipoprotein A